MICSGSSPDCSGEGRKACGSCASVFSDGVSRFAVAFYGGVFDSCEGGVSARSRFVFFAGSYSSFFSTDRGWSSNRLIRY